MLIISVMRIGERAKRIKRVKRLSEDNQGLSLVELMIVIAVMAILTGIVGINISLAFSRDAENCAKKIDTELEKVRMSSMSERGDYWLELEITPSGPKMSYCSEVSGRTPEVEKIDRKLSSQIGISFEVNGAVHAATQIRIAFDKSTGRVKRITDEDNNVLDANTLRIRCVNSSGKRVATVVLIKRTGKHYVEYSYE